MSQLYVLGQVATIAVVQPFAAQGADFNKLSLMAV
jgi:hypothetical protein